MSPPGRNLRRLHPNDSPVGQVLFPISIRQSLQEDLMVVRKEVKAGCFVLGIARPDSGKSLAASPEAPDASTFAGCLIPHAELMRSKGE